MFKTFFRKDSKIYRNRNQPDLTLTSKLVALTQTLLPCIFGLIDIKNILTFYFRSSFPNVLRTSTPPHHLPTSERTKCNRHSFSFRFVFVLFCFVGKKKFWSWEEKWDMDGNRERETDRKTDEQKGLIERTWHPDLQKLVVRLNDEFSETKLLFRVLDR